MELNGHTILPRMIILSDGLITESGHTGPDTADQSAQVNIIVFSEVLEIKYDIRDIRMI